jgi:hypothetical protein
LDRSFSAQSDLPTPSWLRRHTLLLALLGVYLGVVIPLALAVPMWVDEAFSLHTSSLPLLKSLRAGFFLERQAPLYFGLLHLWRAIHPSPEFARLFSVLCGAATLVVGARLSRHAFPDLPEVCLPALLAFHPLFLYAALEIRVYALAILLAACLLLFFLRAFCVEGAGRRSEIAFGLLAAVALYTQYYLGFLLVSLWAALLATRRWRAAVRYLRPMALAGLLAVPLLLTIPGQMRISESVPTRFSPRDLLQFLLERYDYIVLPAFNDWAMWVQPGVKQRALFWAFRLLPWVAVAVAVRRAGFNLARNRALTLWWGALACLGLMLGAIGIVFGQHLVVPFRYATLFTVPGTVALLALLAVFSRRMTLACVLLLVVSNGALTWERYRIVANEDLKVLGFGLFNKGGEARQIAQYIQRHEGPGQPIVVFPSDQALVLANYYHGVNRLVPLPRPLPLDRFDYRNLVVPSEGAVEEALVGQENELVWLVCKHLVTMDGVSLNLHHVLDFFGSRYEVVQEQQFIVGTVVRLLRRIPTTREPELK